jgi:hypothetical protein
MCVPSSKLIKSQNIKPHGKFKKKKCSEHMNRVDKLCSFKLIKKFSKDYVNIIIDPKFTW